MSQKARSRGDFGVGGVRRVEEGESLFKVLFVGRGEGVDGTVAVGRS